MYEYYATHFLLYVRNCFGFLAFSWWTNYLIQLYILQTTSACKIINKWIIKCLVTDILHVSTLCYYGRTFIVFPICFCQCWKVHCIKWDATILPIHLITEHIFLWITIYVCSLSQISATNCDQYLYLVHVN